MSASVLVVEDDPASLELMIYLLAAHGYRVIGACRGDEGLDIAKRELPDLIICDIQLPGLDGYAFANQLKAHEPTRHLPLVAVTAMAMMGDRDRGLAAGFDAYLSKPIDPSAFVAEIESLLRWEHRSPTQSAAKPAAADSPVQPSRGTLLVVDDCTVNVDLMRGIFEPHGYRVLVAGTAVSGLQATRDESPDLVISDIGLPDASGLEFLRSLKSDLQLRHIPVIIITSTHAGSSVRNEALSLGAERFLIRPMDSQHLLEEIETSLRQRIGER